MTKDYIIDNQIIDDNKNIVDYSLTTLKTINQDLLNRFTIFPLDNNLYSLDYVSEYDNNAPLQYDFREGSKRDKNRLFRFNKELKRYAFVSDGNRLVYFLDTGESATIGGMFYLEDVDEKQYLFECKNDKITFGLFRNKDKRLLQTNA